jgi:GT2 family glycosyltransferase/glycosyltransferase involved in cell wall biosynthesis
MTRTSIVVAHPSPDLYGSDRVLLESVSALVAAGRRVVVALPGVGPLAEELVRRGAVVEYVPCPVLRKAALRPMGMVRMILETARALPAMVRLLRRESPAAVYVNTITVPLWLAVARMTGARLLCHVHEAEGSQSATVRRLLYLPLLLAHVLVVNSRFSMGVLSESWRVLERRCRLVLNGVPGPEQAQGARAVLDSPVELLFVGRLSPRKGPQVALAALRQLEAAQPGRFRLSLLGAVFPGYEWFERELREFVAVHGLEDRVHFLGFDPAVWGHLAHSDIVLVPSTVDEPFGNTAVEAMLAMRPLVVSDTSGLKEAAEGYRSARFVPAGDADAIAGAVTAIVEDWPAVTGDSAADRLLARRRHDPAVYQAGIRGVVEELSASGPARSGYGDQLRQALEDGQGAPGPDLGVVIVNFGSGALLERNVAPDLSPVAKVVVVDNFSDTQEREGLRDLAAARGWELVEPASNLGFGEAVNRGVLRAAQLGCRVFVTLNPDATADAATLGALGQAVAARPDALVSPVVLHPDGRPYFRGSTINLRTGRIRSGWVPDGADQEWSNWLSGACLAFSGEAFAGLDGFDPDYFLYWEDVDLSLRATASNLTLTVREDLVVTHDEGGTHTPAGSVGKSPLYYYYNTRNRLLLCVRLLPRRDRLRWILESPREAVRIWLRGGRRQLLSQPGGVLAALRGTVEGLGMALRHARRPGLWEDRNLTSREGATDD